MGDINIPGFPTGMLVPGIYLNVELGRQPPSAAGVSRKVLLVGENDGLEGSAVPGVVYPVPRLRNQNDDDTTSAESLFGIDDAAPSNTTLYWMAKAAFAANALVDLYAVRVKLGEEEENWDKVLDPVTGPAVARQFHYIAISDKVQRPLLKTYLETLAQPMYGIRQQGIVGTYTVLPVAPVSDPSPRIQYIRSPQFPVSPPFTGNDYYPGYMLAAAVAAVRARHESVDPAVNLSMEKVPGVPLPPISNSIPKSELNTQLGNGFTPLVSQGTSTCILRSVTTNANPLNTYPVFDTTKVTVTDFVADDIEMKMLNRYTGFKLAPDTDIPPPSRTATPNGIRSSLLEWLREHEKAGRITTVADLAERVIVEIDDQVPGRVNFQIPEDVIEIFAVGAGNIMQIG
jgi:hypothetical protein